VLGGRGDMLGDGGRPGSSGCEIRPGAAATKGENFTSDRAQCEVRSGRASAPQSAPAAAALGQR
jgi:hypothetical protein